MAMEKKGTQGAAPVDTALMKKLIDTATKREAADLVLKEAQVMDVFSGKLERKDVAIKEGYIAALGKDFPARETLDLKGAYLLPGFIDAHIHLESSLVSPAQFCKATLARGTTALVADPHEIANVLGLKGVEYMLSITRDLPQDFFFTAPSCVPATNLETSGAVLGVRELDILLEHPRVLGLGEVMNFPGVIEGDLQILEKIHLALAKGKKVEGHAPGLTGEALSAYVAPGITSDHECVHLKEAEEKLKRGMYIMIREGSTAKNMSALIPLVRAFGVSRFMLVTDDRHPQDLLEEGHMDFLLRKAVYMGIAPNLAVRMATFNPAFYFNLKRRGAIAPGYMADMVVVRDLRDFSPMLVFKEGRLVAEEGVLLEEVDTALPEPPPPSFNIKLPPRPFALQARGTRARAIKVIPHQIVTEEEMVEPTVKDGWVLADPSRDILKVAVVERHRGTGNVGVGLIRGFGLKEGALASSVAHDSHNVVVVGVSDQEMLVAVKKVEEMGGGLVVVRGEEVLAALPLPLAGLVSLEPVEEVARKVQALHKAARQLGCILDNPFMALSFLALPVIPKLKITDLGLVDVEKFQVVEVFPD